MDDNVRKDSWTPEQDQLLAEIVLEHIRNGETQLKAFNVAAERLERSQKACGFRWNSEVRKQHTEELSQIKPIRGRRKTDTDKDIEVVTIEDTQPVTSYAEHLEAVKDYITRLETKNKQLQAEIERLKAEQPKEDLSNLLAILERAKHIATKIS